jgi:hypothetical protein
MAQGHISLSPALLAGEKGLQGRAPGGGRQGGRSAAWELAGRSSPQGRLAAMELLRAGCCCRLGREEDRRECVRGREKEKREWRLGKMQGWEWKFAKWAPLFIEAALGLGFLSGPIGLGWIWPKTRNRVALNIFRNKNAPAEFVATEKQSEKSSDERKVERLIRSRV